MMRENETRISVNHTSRIRMTNDEIRTSTEIQMTNPLVASLTAHRPSGFGFPSSFVIRHLSCDTFGEPLVGRYLFLPLLIIFLSFISPPLRAQSDTAAEPLP